MRYSVHLREALWERIKGSLPWEEGDVGITAHDNRRFVEGLIWLGCNVGSGVFYRKKYGCWHTVYPRFSGLAKKLFGTRCCTIFRGMQGWNILCQTGDITGRLDGIAGLGLCNAKETIKLQKGTGLGRVDNYKDEVRFS